MKSVPAKIICLMWFILPFTGYSQASFDKVDEWLGANVEKMGGRAILVIYKDGHKVYAHAENELSRKQKLVGRFLARRQGKQADTEDYTTTTRQPIASCSKWLSAALIMTFVDEGKLKLSDTVGKYLPVLSANGKGNITISHCLSHLTGIKAASLKESLDELKDISTMNEAILSIAKQPMEGEPGKVFHYSNAGLQIAGAVIEKISGKRFQDLFAERIAGPLNMHNTDFGKGKVALPAGGANSTPDDYTNFLVMILNKGMFNGKRILQENSVAEMQVNRITNEVKIASSPAEAGNFGYGYGEWIMEAATPAHGGAITSPGLFGSFPWVDNERKYTGFLMCFYLKNDGRHERYEELKKLVDEALAKR